MKKALLLATALMLGTPAAFVAVPAFAQDATMPAPSGEPAPGPNEASPAPDTTMPSTTDQPMTPPAPEGAGAPVPVAEAPMSPAAPPAASGQEMAAAPMASDPSSYPTCSRTVKDRCKNRGGR